MTELELILLGLLALMTIVLVTIRIPEDEKPRRVDLTATSILDDIGREVDAKVFR